MRFTPLLRNANKVLIRSSTGNPTGLTGILTHPNPRPALIAVYEYTLKQLNEKFPPSSVYRQSVESLTNQRLHIVKENEITEVIEKKIGAGLIEEVLIQADEELTLLDQLAELKCWEELEEKPLEDQWTYFGKKI